MKNIKKAKEECQMKELSVFIDTNSKIPAYEQIYTFIKEEIMNGHLKAGEALPSSRVLAESLQFSRSTILMAYDQLAAEGYIETRPQKGCYVMELEEGFRKNREPENFDNSATTTEKYEIDFSPVGIETDNFPYNEWRKISKQIISSENAELLNSGNAKGDIGLRESIAGYLRDSRGVRAHAERIILGSGYENLLMILNFILNNSTVFAMENPVYPKAYRLIRNLGRRIIPVRLDEYGISVEELENTDAEIAYVTPSHQYPLGIVMSVGRRQELLQWAYNEEGRYIIEDDYDSEFRYKGKPIPALQGLDTQERVIYIGTFSKSISPAIRMSYMVLPQELMNKYYDIINFCSNTVSRLDQKIVQIFMESGGFERHLNRMRTIYKNKHSIMLSELKNWENTEILGENAGAHMLVRIKNNMTEEELVQKAAHIGIKVYSLKNCYIGERKMETPVIMLGYAKLNLSTMEEGLRRLKQEWKV